MPRTDRRRFLEHTAAGLAACLVASGTVDGADLAPPIVDTHQHLWDLKRFRLPWLKADGPLLRSYLPEDYRKATAGLNVEKSIYMEVDVAPEQQVEEACAIVELIRSKTSPTVAAVISGRPASEGFEAYLEQFRHTPEIKGIRQVLHSPETPAGYCLDPKFVRGIRRLGAIGWSFDLCMRPEELRDGLKLVELCPETSFILDHCGNAPVFGDLAPWKTAIRALGKRKNLICKVSGIIASTQGRKWTPDDLAPVVNHVLDSFGPDRVVFGGDWPVCTLGAPYKVWVETLRELVRRPSRARPAQAVPRQRGASL